MSLDKTVHNAQCGKSNDSKQTQECLQVSDLSASVLRAACTSQAERWRSSLSRAWSPLEGLQAAAQARVHQVSCLSQTRPGGGSSTNGILKSSSLRTCPCCLFISPQMPHGSGDFHCQQQSVKVLDAETPPLWILPLPCRPMQPDWCLFQSSGKHTHTGPHACFAPCYQLISR